MISSFELTASEAEANHSRLGSQSAFLLVPFLFRVGVGISRKSPRVYLLKVTTRVHDLGVL